MKEPIVKKRTLGPKTVLPGSQITAKKAAALSDEFGIPLGQPFKSKSIIKKKPAQSKIVKADISNSEASDHFDNEPSEKKADISDNQPVKSVNPRARNTKKMQVLSSDESGNIRIKF